ncbi:hypothetical protein BDW62DRAFT_216284 [Aspergillus aurantiobrunneus]
MPGEQLGKPLQDPCILRLEIWNSLIERNGQSTDNETKEEMQSCDICRKRKVKCDRQTPCARCRRLRQPCTYTDILRKKGPKFVHTYPSIYISTTPYTTATASSETLVSASLSEEALPLLTRGNLDLEMEMAMDMEGFMRDVDIHERVDSRAGTGTTPELDFGAVQQLQQGLSLDPSLRVQGRAEVVSRTDMGNSLLLYAKILHPLFPVVDLHEIRLGLRLGHGNGSTLYALLCSLCAAVHAHLTLSSSSSEQDFEREDEHEPACERYLHDALRARALYGTPQISPQNGENSDGRERDKMLSSFFLFMTYWNLRREKHAWWYLRECIALLMSSRMHREDEYEKLEPREAESRRVVFWGVFIAERTFCLLHDKPITLRPWIDLPRLPSVLDEEGMIPGFVRLVTMFQGVSLDLCGCWTAAGFVTPVTLNPAIAAAHGHGDMDAGVPIQRLELAVTREWLRARVWKLGIPGQRSSLEFVASKENAHWRLDEPLSIGKATHGVLQSWSHVLQDNWNEILDQKLCDICECLYDIQPVMSMRRRVGELDLDQILRGLLEALSRVGGRSAYLLSNASRVNSEHRRL